MVTVEVATMHLHRRATPCDVLTFPSPLLAVSEKFDPSPVKVYGKFFQYWKRIIPPSVQPQTYFHTYSDAYDLSG
jgi:hypothetical protein